MSGQQHSEVESEAKEVADRLGVLGAALRTDVNSALANHRCEKWQERKEEALHPSAEFDLAKRIVAALATKQGDEGVTLVDLANEVGAAGADDATFLLALNLAAVDGFVVEDQDDCWRLTPFADRSLNDSEYAHSLEAKIVAYVQDVGLADRDELATAVHARSPTAVEFLAGLERALASGAVVWLAWSVYGVPVERLENAKPPAQIAPSSSVKPDLKKAALDLGVAVHALTQRLTASAAAVDTPQEGTSQTDLLGALERLGRLRETGVLTPTEFASKKAEILARI
jgi:hypothetical protein